MQTAHHWQQAGVRNSDRKQYPGGQRHRKCLSADPPSSSIMRSRGIRRQKYSHHSSLPSKPENLSTQKSNHGGKMTLLILYPSL
jgi:hypothetical protein